MGLNDNTRRIKDALEQNQTLQERKQNEKIHKNNLKLALNEEFYKYFRKYSGGQTKDKIINLYEINTREKIIFKIAKNEPFDATFLNTIYEKELQKTSKIFLNNDKYIERELKAQEELEQEEQEKINKIIQEQAQKEENRKQNIKAFLKMITLSIKFVFSLILRLTILYYKSFDNFSKNNLKEGENLLFLCVSLFFGLRQSN